MAEAQNWFEAEGNREWLAAQGHPTAKMRSEGFSALDWWLWVFENAGVSGKLAAFKDVKFLQASGAVMKEPRETRDAPYQWKAARRDG